MMQSSYPDRLQERQATFQLLLSKEEQTTLAERRHPDNLHSASAPQARPDEQHVPSGYNRPDHQLKYSKSYTLPAMTHILSPAE